MSIKNNTTGLQEVLEILSTKASGGEQATPKISVNSSGLITATAGTKSSTYQMAFQAAKTITPSTASQIAVSSGYYTGGDITVAAVPTQTKSVIPSANGRNVTPDSGKFLSKVIVAGDDNLVAENIKSGVSIFGVSGTAEVSGETIVDDVSKAIIEGTITEISDNEVQIIKPYTFHFCTNLTTVSFSVCTSIGSHAFMDCSNLTSISFPACTSIGQYAFNNCTKLATVSFPVCTSIGSSAFRNCFSLTTASFPTCTSIGSSAFRNCFSLTTASFPVCASIRAYAFEYCRTLSTLQLGASSVCTLMNSNAFSSTPFAGYSTYFSGTPYIYVPSSLITTYQSSTNWTYFSSYFSSIESLESGDNSESGTDNESGSGSGDGTVITFKIESTTYQAESGMTWKDWCDSTYNTDGFWYDTSSHNIYDQADTMAVCDAMDNYVIDSDIIQENGEYFAGELMA